MRCGAFPDTSGALLRTLHGDARNAEAWRRFVQTYGPRILKWARRWGLQDADAHDVTQMALVQFFRQVQTFQYDSTRRFRGWLRRLVHSACCDFIDGSRDWQCGKGGSAVLRGLDSLAARDDLAEQIQNEHDRIILRLAMQRVEARVQERTWQAFRLLNIEERSGLDVAKRLGMRLGTAFAASSKVRRMIRREVELLESLEA